MSTDIERRGPQSALAIADGQSDWTEKQIAAIRQLGAEEAGDGDLAVFFHQATRTGLDPFARQIYLIGRRENKRIQVNGEWVDNWSVKYTIQTGIDGFRLIARRAVDRAHETLGYEDTLWCGADGKWRDAWFYSDPPMAAKVTVLRNGQPFPAIAHFREYAQTTGQGDRKKLTSMWERMPSGQIAKCAEALALRKAFPQDLSGLYIDEEMNQADQRAEEAAAPPAPRQQQPQRASATRVVDGEAGQQAPAAERAAQAAEKRTAEQWLTELNDCGDLDCTRELYRQAARAGQLQLDVDGIDLGDRIKARAEKIADAEEKRLREQAANPASSPQEPPGGGSEGQDTGEVSTGSAQAPVEGEVLDAEPKADPDVRDGKLRKAVLDALDRVFGGGEHARTVVESAAEQKFGKPLGMVGQAALSAWLTEASQVAA